MVQFVSIKNQYFNIYVFKIINYILKFICFNFTKELLAMLNFNHYILTITIHSF